MHTPTTVLAVDDDGVDIMIFERAFRRFGVKYPLVAAHDGVQALEWLREQNSNGSDDPPVIVLLDLNMPRMNGHEFLAELRNDPTLSKTVVFVLTTSCDQRDIERAYQRQAAGYFVKDDAGDDYGHLVRFLDAYLNVVTPPH